MNTIPELIAKGRVRQALDVLLAASKETDSELYEQALMLSARYEQFSKDKRLGLIESDRELRKVELGIIEINNLMVEKPRKKKHLFRYIIFGFGLIAALLLIRSLINKLVLPASKSDDQTIDLQANNQGTTPAIIETPASITDQATTRPISSSSLKATKAENKANAYDSHKNTAMDSTANQILEKPEPNQLSENPVTIIPNVVEREYITFTLFLNDTYKNISININGAPAEIVEEPIPNIKIIQIEKTTKSTKIELFIDGKLSCTKNQKIIDNQKIAMPCSE